MSFYLKSSGVFSFWSRVNHLQNQCNSDVTGLKCGRQLTRSELVSGLYVYGGARGALPAWRPELQTHLLHETLSDCSTPRVHSNWAFLYHFLWSSLTSYTTSAFPTVSSTALGTLWVAFTGPAGVVPRRPLWAIRNSWAELKDNSSANHILRVLSSGKCAEAKQACGF